jgi:FkbH-like protein
MFGSFDAVLEGSRRNGATASNAAIRDLVREGGGDLLFDVSALANSVGLIDWHDPVQWNLAKLPFAVDMIPLYAEHLARLIAAVRGKSRKCLVLDLDNTCWGGVIGDDGLAGIVLGQGGAIGEAFLEVQRTALALRDRGVILAVCSKNDDAVARTPFRDHPEMLLREEHVAAFFANWTDKATNLEAIAGELNIGLDALVFLDDNPAERAQVRQVLPQVAVPELPEDPSLYARTLLAGGYFEAIAFSDDDRQRAAQYQANQARESIRKSSRDLGSYLESLAMVATMRPFDDIGRARVTQLINKSNQFNLTTRRYTEAQVQALETDPTAVTLQVRLQDCFGDNGIVSVIIAHQKGDTLDIDTWLMSCRVLGRELEYAVLNQLAEQARRRGAARITGRFIASGRNEMVREHYAKLGFSPGDEPDHWTLNLAAFEPRVVRMTTVTGVPEPA